MISLKGFYSLHPHIPSGSGRGGSCISEQLKEKLSDRPFVALIHLITTIQLCIHEFFWYLHLHRYIPWDPLHSGDRVYCSHHCHHHRDWGLWRKSIDVSCSCECNLVDVGLSSRSRVPGCCLFPLIIAIALYLVYR